MIFAQIMRWREGDSRREGAEIISRKVLTESDSWRLELLFKVKLRYSGEKPGLLDTLLHLIKSEHI